MALSLPLWATDCLRRADPAIGMLEAPFALWERQHNAMQLAAVDARASNEGLYVGQSLSDARSMVPGLVARMIDRPFLEQRFADFADWQTWTSPLVAVQSDRAAYGDLMIDIAGVAHLFGGEEKLLAAVTGRLAGLGYTVSGAIAGSIGAAWALAHHDPGSIVSSGGTAEAIAGLPVAALRLEQWQVDGLNQLGLRNIGSLLTHSRKALQARFGQSLILRIDQALGHVEERIVPRLPVPDRSAERRFADPIALIDDVLMTAEDLAFRLSSQLEGEGLGARTFHLLLYRVDHKVMTLSVNAASPTRDARHIARLFKHRSERLGGEYDAGFGIDMIRLAAQSLFPLTPAQSGAFDNEDGAADLDKLYDRMTNRLGPLAVVRSKFVNTHIPEQAVKLEPVVARMADDPEAKPDPGLPRPLRLLPAPEPVTVALAEVPDGPPPGMVWRRVRYRFLKVSGPERIGAEWWQDEHKLEIEQPPPGPVVISRDHEIEEIRRRPVMLRLTIPSRDYFIAEDDGGRRFWLFREGLYGEGGDPRWYLHGFFA
jgi:protein ImuB